LGYVVELQPAGYIVLAADSALTPIIAYSATSTFSWDDTLSNALLDLLRVDLSSRLDALNDGALSSVYEKTSEQAWNALQEPTNTVTSTGDSQVVGPLLEATTWAQGAPWNHDVPIDPTTGEPSAVGCVATTLAQLVVYWRYPASITFSHESDYVTRTRHISVSAPEASMSSIAYPSRSFYNPSDEVMAELSYAAGVSVRMDYSSDGSGALLIDMAYALAGSPTPLSRDLEPAVWGYESADIRSYVMTGWGAPFATPQSAFYKDLQSNLSNSIPVVLNIVSSRTTRGHSIICDGYDATTDLYHLNLGWGGQCDGWYNLPADVPSGYNVVEYGVFNIHPPEATGKSSSNAPPEDATMKIAPSNIRVLGNPLSSETRFEYSAGVPDTFTVRVFSLAGTLLWESSVSGESDIAWNGRTSEGSWLANGPYVYVASGVDGSAPFAKRGVVFILR
jgi:hypothetical protein